MACPGFLQVHAHEVFVTRADAGRNGPEGSGGHNQHRHEREEAVNEDRYGHVDGRQWRGSKETHHSACATEPVKSFAHGRLSPDDVRQGRPRQRHHQ